MKSAIVVKLLLLIVFLSPSIAIAQEWTFKGHGKYQFYFREYADDAWFSQLGAQRTDDHFIDLRLMTDKHWGKWDGNIQYQLIGIAGDTLETTQTSPTSVSWLNPGIVSDKRKLFNLTNRFHESQDRVGLHRLDRLSLGYTAQNLVVRVGREAISWGNGLYYNPVDVFNPFAPDTVDKDYKSGDDLAYTQWLFANGDDIQGVVVPRRNIETGDVDGAHSSAAVKYHGFFRGKEYDALAARHNDDPMLAVGLATDWLESVVRGDIVATFAETRTIMSAVANISYSWVWFNKNMSGFLEYFYNGFGQQADDYSLEALAANSLLLERIQRGELFTLGKHYLGANLSLEMAPLTVLSTNVFVNATDPSALFQLVFNADWRQNMTMLAGLNLPLGARGSEFGGIPTASADVYYRSGNALFLQLAYFF